MAEETLLLLKNLRTPGYTGDLAAYQKAGGHQAWEKALTAMKAAEVIEVVKASGLRGRGGAVDGPFGLMPKYGDLRWEGLSYDRESYGRITDIGKADVEREVQGVREWYAKFGEHLPKALAAQLENLTQRGAAMAESWRAGRSGRGGQAPGGRAPARRGGRDRLRRARRQPQAAPARRGRLRGGGRAPVLPAAAAVHGQRGHGGLPGGAPLRGGPVRRSHAGGLPQPAPVSRPARTAPPLPVWRSME